MTFILNVHSMAGLVRYFPLPWRMEDDPDDKAYFHVWAADDGKVLGDIPDGFFNAEVVKLLVDYVNSHSWDE